MTLQKKNRGLCGKGEPENITGRFAGLPQVSETRPSILSTHRLKLIHWETKLF